MFQEVYSGKCCISVAATPGVEYLLVYRGWSWFSSVPLFPLKRCVTSRWWRLIVSVICGLLVLGCSPLFGSSFAH